MRPAESELKAAIPKQLFNVVLKLGAVAAAAVLLDQTIALTGVESDAPLIAKVRAVPWFEVNEFVAVDGEVAMYAKESRVMVPQLPYIVQPLPAVGAGADVVCPL